MNRTIPMLVGIAAMMAAAPALTSAQTLSGRVVDTKNEPLVGAQVAVPGIHRGSLTDRSGRFVIRELPPRQYTIEFRSIGYRSVSLVVDLSDGDTTLLVTLEETALEGSTVTITAKPQAALILSTPQSTAVVGGRQLERDRKQSVIESISSVPGVSTYSTGSGVVKPVIRGLTSQRVLVLSDGVRQEGQQWGDEHGPEIDAFDVDRVEVVRGPNSVLYGSDALGGVVNIVRPGVPSSMLGSPTLSGTLTLNGFSNNRQGSGAVALSGAGGVIGYRATLSGRHAGDITTPGGTLSNSGAEELNASALVGALRDWGTVSAGYSHFSQSLRFHEPEPDATGFQEVRHDKASLHTDYQFELGQLELNSGWQMNDRKEFEQRDAAEAVLHLKLNTLTLDLKGHHRTLGPLTGTAGLALMSQTNSSRAEEKLIPDFGLFDVAGFLYEEAPMGDFSLSGGARIDSRVLDVDESSELGVASQTKSFTNISGTLGVIWHATEALSFVANAGRGWRAPTPFEMFVDGIHEGTTRYEIGSNRLAPERSFNIDLSTRYDGNRLQGELTVYHNRINSFIYLSPTERIDSASGFAIFLDRQADATLLGGELGFELQAADWIVLNAGASVVRGTNDETTEPLPLMPADRLTLGTRLIQPSVGPFRHPYLSMGVKIVADQNRIETYERPTGGYVLLDAGLGADLPFAGREIRIDLRAENLGDTAYRDHLSRYKAYALNPGRDISLKLSIPFTLAE